jgi:hypothetical protein
MSAESDIERRVSEAEARSAEITEVIRHVIDGLDLSDEQRARAGALAAEALRKVARRTA